MSPNSTDLAAVVNKRKIPFSCSIKLPDLNLPKPAYELSPNICSDPIAYCKSYLVTFIIECLSGKNSMCFGHFSYDINIIISAVTYSTYLWFVAQVSHNFTNVQYDSDLISSAIIPELGCRKFILQSNRDT